MKEVVLIVGRNSIGTDNPFRPGGELSKEADEIVNLIKQGKPLTPVSSPVPDVIDGRLSGQSGSLDTATETIVSGRASSTAVTDSPAKLSKKEKAQQKKAEKELRKQLKANGIGNKVADRITPSSGNQATNGKKKSANKTVDVTQIVVEDKSPEFAESVVLPKAEGEEDKKGCCNRGCTLLWKVAHTCVKTSNPFSLL